MNRIMKTGRRIKNVLLSEGRIVNDEKEIDRMIEAGLREVYHPELGDWIEEILK